MLLSKPKAGLASGHPVDGVDVTPPVGPPAQGWEMEHSMGKIELLEYPFPCTTGGAGGAWTCSARAAGAVAAAGEPRWSNSSCRLLLTSSSLALFCCISLLGGRPLVWTSFSWYFSSLSCLFSLFLFFLLFIFLFLKTPTLPLSPSSCWSTVSSFLVGVLSTWLRWMMFSPWHSLAGCCCSCSGTDSIGCCCSSSSSS